jgi:hypothetical protein
MRIFSARGDVVGYKPEGRGLGSWWGHRILQLA